MEQAGRFFSSRLTAPPDRNSAEFLKTYTQNPRLAPVTKIATDLAAVEGRLFRVGPDGKRDEITDHPFLDFMREPNPMPYMTRSALWKCIEQYLLIKGEGACVIERDGSGYPVELWPLPSHWILDIPRLDRPFYTIRSRDGLQMDVDVEDMFLMRQLNPLDPYGRGLGDSEAIADEIETDEYMAKWAKKFFYNDATPPVVISAPGATGDEIKRFEASWNDRFRGVGNSHRTGIIPRDIKFQKLVDSQREMDFAASRKDIRDAVNAHFGIPPEILGIVENSNRATATQAKVIYAENVLMPRLRARQDAINLQLLSYWGDDLLWEFEDIVPADEEFKLSVSNSGLEKSALMIDEWREENGYDPLPNGAGQVLFIPFSSIPTKPAELTKSVRNPGFGFTQKSVKSRERNLQIAKQEQLRRLAAEERRAQMIVDRFLDRQLQEILQALSSGQKAEGDSFWDQINITDRLQVDIEALSRTAKEALAQLIDWGAQDEALAGALSPVWQHAFEQGAQSVEQIYGISAVQSPSLTDYLRQYGLQRVGEINETTRDELARSLAEGIEAGEGQAQLIRRIQEHMPHVQAGRAGTIAATEAHTSMQAGSLAQMQYGGVMTKTWAAVGDIDTRDSHMAINGETVPINQPFSNGLMYPGDPSGPPEQIIHCRCELVPGDFWEDGT